MRYFLIRFSLLLSLMAGLLLTLPVAFAQNATPDMIRFSQLEERILQQRRAFAEQEQAVQEPLWVVDAQGMYHIIDGANFRASTEGASSIAEMMIVDSMSIDGFDFANGIIAAMVAERLASADPVGKILGVYREHSIRNRATALGELDRFLEFAREQFALSLANRDAELQVGAHPCQQVQSLDSRRFFFRHYGNSDLKFFVQNGGFYCQVPRFALNFDNEESYGYATISGEYITWTSCPDGECVTSPFIYKAIFENEGDRNMDGVVYRDTAQEATAGWLATFHWWQCHPHDGTSKCANDLVIE